MNRLMLIAFGFIYVSCSHLQSEKTFDASSLNRIPSQETSVSKKPFHTALVISGENMNTPLFVGMIDGLAAQGKVPDVIIASCGGSIAAAIIQSIPDKEERLKFLTSEEYHKTLRDLQFDDPTLVEFTKRLLKIRKIAKQQQQIAKTGQRWMPNIFSYSIATLSPDLFNIPTIKFNQQFKAQSPRLIFIAAKVDFYPEDFLKKEEDGRFIPADTKLFTQTFFTDPETSQYLKDFPAAAYVLQPNSSIAEKTEVITDANLFEAVRASISDPLLINTVKFRDNYYLTGGVNIDPIDVAQQLADEVISKYPKKYSSLVEQPPLMQTFGFDANAIRENMVSRQVDYWIDDTTKFPSFGLGLVPNFLEAIKKVNPARIYKFGHKVPKDYNKFVKLVQAQYEAGFKKATETMQNPRFDRLHITNRLEKIGEEPTTESPYGPADDSADDE